MTVSRKHHSSSYNNPINMKFVQLALVFLAFVVLVFAAPPNRQKKLFRPNPRIHRQADETTTFRTYQPKYNPFKSSVLRTSSTNSVTRTNATLPLRSEFRFRQASLRKELSIDPTNISAPVEEPVTSSTDATWSTDPELPSPFAELESSSPSSISETSPSSFLDSVSSSLPPVSFSQSYATSKPTVSTTSEPYVSTSSPLTSNTIPNAPVLLRPSTSTAFKPESSKSSSDSSFRTVSSLESVPSSTPKSSFSSLPRTNTLDPSARVPKALESSPNRSPSITTQTSTSSASFSVSTPLRSAKSLPSPPQSAAASVVPVSTNYEPKSKVSPVSSFVPSPPRSAKSASVQSGSTGYTNGVPTSYSFAYKVNDPLTNQDFGHTEKRVGNNTKGRYDVLLPDGRRQVVDYQVLDDRGYVADVTYQSS